MFCYNALDNKFFHTNNSGYLKDLCICEVHKGLDISTILETWHVLSDDTDYIYKRPLNDIYLSPEEVCYNRRIYFTNLSLCFDKRILTNLIIPSDIYMLMASAAPFKP